MATEDREFLQMYRATERKRLVGAAQAWEVRWLARHAELARELSSREQSAKAA